MQGGKNSGANFQSRVAPLFASLQDNTKAWTDNFLLRHSDEAGLLEVLRKFFAICRERRLKLSAKRFYSFSEIVRKDY